MAAGISSDSGSRQAAAEPLPSRRTSRVRHRSIRRTVLTVCITFVSFASERNSEITLSLCCFQEKVTNKQEEQVSN